MILHRYGDILIFARIRIQSDVTFPPNVYCEKKVTTERSTNNCEFFHTKFGELFTSTHPNILNFIKNVLALQTDSYI